MPAQIIRAARALTPLEEIKDAAVVVEDGRIVAIGRNEQISAPANARELKFPDCTLVPGFVDVHIHGGGGHDVMEATSEALAIVAQTAAKKGTTTLIATTVSAPLDATCKCVEGIAGYIEKQQPQTGAQAEIAGIHFEGPFISAARRGVHPPDALLAPTRKSFEKLLQAAHGYARLLTIAPELAGALEVIDAARAAGLVIGLGHTDANYDQAHEGIEHGARHAVHVFNAMRPFSHRETGVLGAVLTDRRVSTEVIADGVHVDAPAIQLLVEAKGADAVILVSDGISATGMPDGQYRLGGFECMVTAGVCRNSEGKLAGSTLTLDRAVRHMTSLGVPIQQAVKMATFNPARQMGLEKKKGVLAPGADADLALLTPELQIAAVMTRGTGL